MKDLVNESCNVKMFSAMLFLGICFYSMRKKRKKGIKETIMKKTSTSKIDMFPDVSKIKILLLVQHGQ